MECMAKSRSEDVATCFEVLRGRGDDRPTRGRQGVSSRAVTHECAPSDVMFVAVVFDRHASRWEREVDARDEAPLVADLELRNDAGEAVPAEQAHQSCLLRALGRAKARRSLSHNCTEDTRAVSTPTAHVVEEPMHRI